jgi:hypothetical protein
MADAAYAKILEQWSRYSPDAKPAGAAAVPPAGDDHSH